MIMAYIETTSNEHEYVLNVGPSCSISNTPPHVSPSKENPQPPLFAPSPTYPPASCHAVLHIYHINDHTEAHDYHYSLAQQHPNLYFSAQVQDAGAVH